MSAETSSGARTASPPVFAVMLAGFAAFLDLYATQPLLPMLARTFRATRFEVSLTVTAATMAVALAAPGAGGLADRFGLRRMIVGSAFALATATLLAAISTTLWQLVAWRFVQGLVTPGLFSTAIAYIHEEWPPLRTGRVTAAYVSGTVIGGVVGRLLSGVIAADTNWSSAFVVLATLGFAAAGALWWWLPPERMRAPALNHRSHGWYALFASSQLLATYAVGFGMLGTQVAMFTYVPFLLAAPPFALSTTALGSIFLTYLLAAAITPFAGRAIDAYGHRAVLIASLGCCAAGAMLTLVPSLPAVAAGLAGFATGVFCAQAASSSHVAQHANRDRALAIGIYTSCYYLGGSVGGAVPAGLWNAGGWPACVAFVLCVEAAMLAIAWTFWQRLTPLPEWPANVSS